MTIAFVQKGSGTADLSAASGTVNCTWDGATVSGNFLVVVITALTATSSDTFTITPPAGWTIAGSQYKTASSLGTGTDMVAIYYKPNVASQSSTGNFTVAVSVGVLINIEITGAEYSGMGTSVTVDATPAGTNVSPGGAATVQTSNTGTLANASELAVGGFLYEDTFDGLNPTTWSLPNAGYNLRVQVQDGNTVSSTALSDSIRAATTTTNAQLVCTNGAAAHGDIALAIIATFIPGAGSTSPVGRIYSVNQAVNRASTY